MSAASKYVKANLTYDLGHVVHYDVNIHTLSLTERRKFTVTLWMFISVTVYRIKILEPTLSGTKVL